MERSGLLIDRQQVGRFIPMTYAAQALKDPMIQNATLSDLFLPMATLASAAVILHQVGVLLYKRWAEKQLSGSVSVEND